MNSKKLNETTKKKLKIARNLLIGLGGLTLLTVSSEKEVNPNNFTNRSEITMLTRKKRFYEDKYSRNSVGVIKDVNEFIPFIRWKGIYYTLDPFEEIGAFITPENGARGIYQNGELKYFTWQILDFAKCDPNVEYNYETITSFNYNSYKNLANEYFENIGYNYENWKIYEIKNITTNLKKFIVGVQLNGTEVFNMKTFRIEEYTGCSIKEVYLENQEELYSYNHGLDEVLEILENYKHDNNKRTLER